MAVTSADSGDLKNIAVGGLCVFGALGILFFQPSVYRVCTLNAISTTRQATRPGDKLLRERPCSLCSSETGGLGAAAMKLLEMIDVLQDRGMSG